MKKLLFCFILYNIVIVSFECAKVLVVFNPLAFSHLLVTNRTVNALRKYNHTFTYLHVPLHENTKNLTGALDSTNLIYGDFFTEAESRGLTNDINDAFFSPKFNFHLFNNGKAYILLLMNSKKTGKLCTLFQMDSFQEDLRRRSFDFVILDSFITPCIRRIADIVNAPYMETVTVSMYPRQMWEIGCPMPFSYVAHDIVRFSGWEVLTFMDRLVNAVDASIPNLLGYLVMYYWGTRYLKTGNVITYSNKDSNVSAFLLNDHPYLIPTRPTLNSIQYMLRSSDLANGRGKINVENFLYLDEYFKRNNYTGCVIVSMSTLSDDLPDVMVHSILNTIIAFPEYYFIWKYYKLFPGVKNLKTANFLPLEYLLRKPQTKLIIAHGGRSTVHESLLNAVPVLGIPTGADHETVLNRAGKYGSISIIKPDILNPDILKSTVSRMLNEKKFSRNAKKLKRLLNDIIIPLDDAASFTNKFIIRHHQKFTKPLGHQYMIFFYFNLDILISFCTFVIIIACLVS